MTTPEQDVESPAPTTGHPVVDAALTEFGTVRDHPPTEQHARISAVVEVLASVLENRHDQTPTPPRPGLPGPR